MEKKIFVVSLIGMIGMAGALAVPLIASSQDSDGTDMGPGMMGANADCGMGSGMMGGNGMGPGMMSGNGMAGGMMNGYGMGPIWRLNLSGEQRTKTNAIADQLRRKHWEIMGKMMDDQAKLRDLYAVSEPDPKAIGAAYAGISKLRQEMIETHVQAMNQARALLTKEQREQLDKLRRESGGTGTRHRGMGMGSR